MNVMNVPPQVISHPELMPSAATMAQQSTEAEFAGVIQQALTTIDNLQTEADAESIKIASGKGNLHETAIAFEKADIAMRLAVKVRNKIVEAYQDVMRMSI